MAARFRAGLYWPEHAHGRRPAWPDAECHGMRVRAGDGKHGSGPTLRQRDGARGGTADEPYRPADAALAGERCWKGPVQFGRAFSFGADQGWVSCCTRPSEIAAQDTCDFIQTCIAGAGTPSSSIT